MQDFEELQRKADTIRKWCLIATTEAGSGHPTTCMSAADITTALFDRYYHFDLQNPLDPANDRFVLSKGHAAPLLYTLYAMAGAYPFEELKTLRKFGSPYEGHPTPNYQFTEAATGSLGQGLSVASGIALAAKKDSLVYKTFVLLGDGEMAEGQIWEAANFASYYALDNLIAIVDVNRFGQSQETMFGHALKEYVNRLHAFGWETVAIDGHNFADITKAFDKAVQSHEGKPFAIIAKTYKGKGVSFLENKSGWHGKAVKKEDLPKALKELRHTDDSLRFALRKRDTKNKRPETGNEISYTVNASYTKTQEIATREVYGEVLAELGKQDPRIFSLDAEVKNSTFAEKFKAVHPDRFIECFIAEQNMVSVAVGLARRGKIPFVSTFAAFLTRGFDQIRMAGVSKANVKLVGSHVGVSVGEDGPSQMGLEDIAMFATIPDSVIFHPADAVSTAQIIPLMAKHSGISYLRTLRPKTPVIYDTKTEFRIGGSHIVRHSRDDIVTVVAAGITVHEALKAYEILKKQKIVIRVLDCYCIKPLDEKQLLKCLKETKKSIVITVEDHYEYGGLGSLVQSALSGSGAVVKRLAVKNISRSGTKDELLDDAGISARYIIDTVKSII